MSSSAEVVERDNTGGVGLGLFEEVWAIFFRIPQLTGELDFQCQGDCRLNWSTIMLTLGLLAVNDSHPAYKSVWKSMIRGRVIAE